MKKLALLFFLCVGTAAAQDSPFPFQPVFSGSGRPLPGAIISICVHPAVGSPCSNFATVYSDQARTQQINQLTSPVKTDSFGNVPATYAAPGLYDYTISGAGISTQGPYSITISCTPGISCVSNPTTGNIVINSPGSLTVNGTQTNTGAMVVSGSSSSLASCRIGGFRYLDTANSCGWTGATADLQLGSAISDLPSTGGTVYLGPGVYTFATTVTITKPNVVIIGSGALRSGSIGNPGATVLRGGTAATPVISITATAWNTKIYHLQIDNEGGTNLSTIAVQIIGGTFHVLLEDVSIGATQKFTTAGIATTNAAISAFLVFRDVFVNGAAPIDMDIDDANGVILDHCALIGNGNTTSGALRLGITSLVTGVWIGNGSDLEIGSGSGNSGYLVQFNKTATVTVRDSFLETNITSTAGTEGQAALLWNSSSSNQTTVEGNYFQGNVHTNYAIVTNGFSPSNIYINQNEFNAFLLAAFNPGSTQTHVIIGDNYYFGGTPAGAFTPALQWVDSSGQFNYGKPILLNGSTSGAVTHAVPATVTSYTETDPGAVPANNNAIKTYTTAGVASFGNTNITFKSGSGAGLYSGTNTTYAAAGAVIDSTNLCLVVTIPTGWKLSVTSSGVMGVNTASVSVTVSLTDLGTTCGTTGSTALPGSERNFTPPAVGTTNTMFQTQAVITGNGAAHAIALQALTSNASDAWTMENPNAVQSPSMIFTLIPSN